MTTCPLCHGKGLLPFKNRADTWVDCECKLEHPEPERYLPSRPEDFDFPCSGTFRAHSYRHCNQADPGYIPPEPPEPEPRVVEHRHFDMSQQDFARLRDLEGQVKYLQDKLTEKQQLKPRQPKPTGYKGIK